MSLSQFSVVILITLLICGMCVYVELRKQLSRAGYLLHRVDPEIRLRWADSTVSVATR